MHTGCATLYQRSKKQKELFQYCATRTNVVVGLHYGALNMGIKGSHILFNA
jgi:hypothetical protein